MELGVSVGGGKNLLDCFEGGLIGFFNRFVVWYERKSEGKEVF